MTVGTKIIENALKEIGAHSIAAPADPESVEIGMDRLNAMLQGWLSDGIDLGIIPLSEPGIELGEPTDTTLAIQFNLSLVLAPLFDNGDNVVSVELKNNASREFRRIENLYETFTIPDKVVSSTLPRGAGNTAGRFRRIFSGKGATIKSTEG